MNDILVLLVIISISSSISFGIAILLDCLLDFPSIWYYKLIKIILVFYLIPIFLLAIIVLNIKISGETMLIEGPDFEFGIKKIDFITLGRIHYNKSLVMQMFTLWQIGIVVSAVLYILAGTLAIRKIIKLSFRITDPSIIELYRELAVDLNIKKHIELYRCPFKTSPFTTGLLKPVIILPDIEFSDSELKLIIRHELIHYKRGDVFFKYIATLIKIIHWFNPIVYLFVENFYEISEYACDAEVIVYETMAAKKDYAELILKIIDISLIKRKNSMLLSIGSDRKKIEKRLKKIMRTNGYSKQKKHLMIFVSMALIVALPIVSYASAINILSLQNNIAKETLERIEKSEDTNPPIEYSRDIINSGGEEHYIDIISKYSNWIDVEIEKGEIIWLYDVVLQAGEIDVALVADAISDEFQVGYISADKIDIYTISKRGSISYSFSIIDNVYSIYIVNTSDHTIHVTGRITM